MHQVVGFSAPALRWSRSAVPRLGISMVGRLRLLLRGACRMVRLTRAAARFSIHDWGQSTAARQMVLLRLCVHARVFAEMCAQVRWSSSKSSRRLQLGSLLCQTRWRSHKGHSRKGQQPLVCRRFRNLRTASRRGKLQFQPASSNT